MKFTFGTNIRITISDEGEQGGTSVTIAGLPAGVDLEKDDFMADRNSAVPEFSEGRLLCKDGSFITDGRPFDIFFRDGGVEDALAAAGVLARHIIAPIRIIPSEDTCGECLCTCLPAGLQIARAAISVDGLCRSVLPETGVEEGVTTGEDIRWKIIIDEGAPCSGNASSLASAIAALSLADALFF